MFSVPRIVAGAAIALLGGIRARIAASMVIDQKNAPAAPVIQNQLSCPSSRRAGWSP